MDKNQGNVLEESNGNNNASGSGNSQDPHQRHGMFTSNVGDLISSEAEQRPNPDSTSENTEVFSRESENVAPARGAFFPHEISFIYTYPCRYCMEPQASTSTHEYDAAAFNIPNQEVDMAMDYSSTEPFPNTSAERSEAVTDLQRRMQTEEPVRCPHKRQREENQKTSSSYPEKKSKFE